tara:strand:- start:1275 stop:1508 length:234 start_codon:yes stop_codon:yes gene_type:complete
MSFQKKIIANLVKPLIPKLESYLKDMPLEDGEIKTIIQLDIDNSDIFISICALKVNENEELVINRVLDSFTADKLAG